MGLTIGDKAPNFTLKNENLEQITLSSFEGKKNVLILFYPFANSSACEKELCTIGDGLSQYTDLNAELLAISVDSHFTLQLWKAKHNFEFTLLSDFNKEVAPKYYAFYDVFVPGKLDYKGVAKRSAFVVDKNGIVQYAEVLESALDEPNYDAIKATLKKLN